MTVNTTKITAGPYNGNDLADTFSYGFTVTDKTELKVYETDDEGVQTLLTVDTDYTVNIGESAGGTITRLAGALPTNYQWYIRSSFDATQDTSFGSQGAFFPEIHEQAMDKLTFLIQQILDTQSRTPVISPAYSGPLNITMDDPESGQFMRWTTDLTGLENVVLDVDGLNQSIVNANESADEADAAVVRVDDAIALLDGNAIPDLKAAAIAVGAKYDEVIYSTDTTTVLDDVLYLFDLDEQVTYVKPSNVGVGEVIVSVDNGVLTTNADTYNLLNAENKIISLDLGAQYTELYQSGFDRIAVNGVTLYNWVDSGDFSTSSHVITDVAYNPALLQYEVTTTTDSFIFVTQDINELRGNSLWPLVTQEIYIEGWGAKAGNSSDISAALNAAISYASTLVNQITNVDMGGYVYSGNGVTVKSNKGVFRLGNQINQPSIYINLDFSNSVILPVTGSALDSDSVSYDDSAYIFNIQSWMNDPISNVRFGGFKNPIRLWNNNLDSGIINVNDVFFSGNDNCYDIEARSSMVVVKGGRYDNVKKVAKISSGDKVIFKEFWLSAGVLGNQYDAFFDIPDDSNSAGLELIDMFYVPRPQTASNLSIVKISSTARVAITRPTCGSEAGGISLVNNFASASASSGRGAHILIESGMAFTSSGGFNVPTVGLYALPNSLVFSNMSGFIEESGTSGLIRYFDDFHTFSEAEALSASDFEIYFNGKQLDNFGGFPRTQLSTLARKVKTPNKTVFGYVTGVTSTLPAEIKEIQTGTVRRNRTLKISITNSGDNSANRYSEYIVSGNFTGSITILPIIEGTAPQASRLTTDGSTVSLITNGSAIASTYTYSITQESNWQSNSNI